VCREFADMLSRTHRKFVGRMLGVRLEFAEGDQKFVGGSLEGAGSSPGVRREIN
ncbi:hypothetical protein B296_00059068, partial [Ensete ventricosum]